MKLTTPQRALLLLSMVFVIALLPLVGSLHHHDHHEDALGGCWFCTTASVATLPCFAQFLAVSLVAIVHRVDGATGPSRFLWMLRHRRGPPQVSIA
ncbi:MAG: hypothetical protein JNK74_18365 [Candidatus Hydrogenedentes bacterium]|nr:hypothetical protein [Candidatus Hydrogenedentota bacterium]